jgi:hypothetical protein
LFGQFVLIKEEFFAAVGIENNGWLCLTASIGGESRRLGGG